MIPKEFSRSDHTDQTSQAIYQLFESRGHELRKVRECTGGCPVYGIGMDYVRVGFSLTETDSVSVSSFVMIEFTNPLKPLNGFFIAMTLCRNDAWVIVLRQNFGDNDAVNQDLKERAEAFMAEMPLIKDPDPDDTLGLDKCLLSREDGLILIAAMIDFVAAQADQGEKQ